MRLARRALETRIAQSLTRQRDRFTRIRRRALRKPSTDRLSGQLLRRGQDAPGAVRPQAIRAIVWTREICPVRTPGKIDKPLWAPTFGGPAETKKARSVVASSRVPRLAGCAGSPPAAGLPGAVNWPLVQIPADRHTTTGTCVLGKLIICANRAPAQGFFLPPPNNSRGGAPVRPSDERALARGISEPRGSKRFQIRIISISAARLWEGGLGVLGRVGEISYWSEDFTDNWAA